MAEMLSAGVYVTEIDASTIAPTVSNSIAVFVGNFNKGPVEDYRLITTVDELISLYGLPDDVNYNDWYQAYNFLQYGNKLYVARAAGTATKNAGIYAPDTTATPVVTNYSAGALQILNGTDFDNTTFSLAAADDKVLFLAKTPGTWANGLKIAVAASTDFGTSADAFTGIALDNLFEYKPAAGEYGIALYDGTNVVETFTVSLSTTAKDHNNKSMYIMDVINNQSNYIYAVDDTANTTALASAIGASALTLVAGVNAAPVAGDLTTGYDLWANKEEVDIDIVIGNELDGAESAFNLANTRKDCIAFFGAYYADTVGKKAADAVSALITKRRTDAVGGWDMNNMFAVIGGNYKYQYDRYNDKNRWINLAGDLAGLRAATSFNRASWWASAGLERGQIKNVKKLAFNPTQGQRDILYKSSINPIVAFPGQGTVMWGQKTLLDRPSSFDRVNVRGLFNTIERSLSKMAKYQVMEFNDNFTRNRIVSMIKPFLGSVQAGRGIEDFLVICDTSNNTPDVISRNQLIVDVYIKPTYVAEFILLRFTNAGTNSFAEIIGGV